MPPEPDATLLLVGDTNLLDVHPRPADVFARVRPLLDAADAVAGQLEGPLTPRAAQAAPPIPHKAWWRHAPPRMAEALLAGGFRAVSCASNVCYPGEAAAECAAVLDAAGIARAGIGADLAEARRPALFRCGPWRVGLLSYTSVFWPHGMAAAPGAPGCATLRAHTAYRPPARAAEMPGAPPEVVTWPDPDDLAAMTADVAALRPRADLLLVSCHWGVSDSEETLGYQRAAAAAAVAAGADLVFGHHPHVIQGGERIGDGHAYHSLGNFAFDAPRMRGRHLDGLALRLRLSAGRLASVEPVPLRRGPDNLIAPAEGAAAREILARHERLSEALARAPAPLPRAA